MDCPLFRFQGMLRKQLLRGYGYGVSPAVLTSTASQRCAATVENCIASTSIFVDFQATKSQRWMPWHVLPMKDVGGCEKPR